MILKRLLNTNNEYSPSRHSPAIDTLKVLFQQTKERLGRQPEGKAVKIQKIDFLFILFYYFLECEIKDNKTLLDKTRR